MQAFGRIPMPRPSFKEISYDPNNRKKERVPKTSMMAPTDPSRTEDQIVKQTRAGLPGRKIKISHQAVYRSNRFRISEMSASQFTAWRNRMSFRSTQEVALALGVTPRAIKYYTNGERPVPGPIFRLRSEEHTSELQSLMRISYAVLFLKKNKE